MSFQRHIIKQQIIELEISSNLNATEIQDQISELYRRQIVPLIDRYCTQFSDPDIIHRIDRLEIDLGEISLESLETDYVQNVANALANQLAQQLSRSPQDSSTPPNDSIHTPEAIATSLKTNPDIPVRSTVTDAVPSSVDAGQSSTKKTSGKTSHKTSGKTSNNLTTEPPSQSTQSTQASQPAQTSPEVKPIDGQTTEERTASQPIQAATQPDILQPNALPKSADFLETENLQTSVKFTFDQALDRSPQALPKDLKDLTEISLIDEPNDQSNEFFNQPTINQPTIKQSTLLTNQTNLDVVEPSSAGDLSISRPIQSSPGDQASSRSQTATANQANLELLETFLTTGQLPWWSQPLSQQELVNCFMQLQSEIPDRLTTRLRAMLNSETTVQRLLYQFPESVWIAILQLFAPEIHSEIQAYLTDIQRLVPMLLIEQMLSAQTIEHTLWQGLLLQIISSQPITASRSGLPLKSIIFANLRYLAKKLNLEVKFLIQQIQVAINHFKSSGLSLNREFSNILTELEPLDGSPELTTSTIEPNAQKALKADLNTPDLTASSQTKNVNWSVDPLIQAPLQNSISTTERYIKNAGLVILWPFLDRLWQTLKLLEASQFRTLAEAQKAALILQYLVDESQISLESNLFFNKLLCGLDLSESLPAQLILTSTEQEECETLLAAAIVNWPVLGNLSIPGFRQAFLQRSGILKPHQDGWLLQVEAQSYDILLDQIPWSLRVIKLSWMREILHVDW